MSTLPSAIGRRTLLKSAGAAGLVLGAPAIVKAADQRVLKLIPQADLAVLDPVWTTAYVTRNHAFMVFDTLYGQDGQFKAQLQMVAGATTENDGKLWKLTLRDGLRFHDGTPVLTRDCVASIGRWGKRDAFGQALLRATDELSAPDDKTIQFRLKQPFPLLPDALGKAGPNMCPIMPERLAQTDAFKQVTEMVGSGPFRFLADERVSGARVAYERFAEYKPRESGTPEWTAGPKIVHFDRVEWQVIPDTATASSAIQRGEVDWWEKLDFDQLPLLKRDPNLQIMTVETTGNIGMLRMNQLFPPFDNPAIRRALLGAVSQTDFMTAVAGDNKENWRTGIGYFTPDTPFANDAGMAALKGPADFDRVKRDLKAAGYKGERVVVMVASDFPALAALGNVGADMLQRCGMNVDLVTTDWGSVVQRRALKSSPEQGGWSVFFTTFTGLDMASPASSVGLRGNGTDGWFGWPTAPDLETLRDQWFAAPDLATQQKIATEMQAKAFELVPFLPLGMYLQPTVQRKTLTGTLTGLPVFWNIRRA
ncbi:MAG TPA: ABC transporter substrate-binding protein [Stellaceae bacterium]|nr:ABC transporter substrate-binding protein [Stellaceae bacterium]